MPNAAALALGPGRLYIAPLGTAEPVDRTTALPAAWREVGYTTEGSEISYSFGSEPIEVAENLDPLFHVTTSRTGSIAFSMAENTVSNMVDAFGGGTVTKTGTGATEEYTYQPPAPGKQVRRMLAWQSEDNRERWVFRQVFQTGDVTIARRKGAEYASLPVSFAIEASSDATKQPFVIFFKGGTDGLGGGAVATS